MRHAVVLSAHNGIDPRILGGTLEKPAACTLPCALPIFFTARPNYRPDPADVAKEGGGSSNGAEQ